MRLGVVKGTVAFGIQAKWRRRLDCSLERGVVVVVVVVIIIIITIIIIKDTIFSTLNATRPPRCLQLRSFQLFTVFRLYPLYSTSCHITGHWIFLPSDVSGPSPNMKEH
jgi:hypothetical protein